MNAVFPGPTHAKLSGNGPTAEGGADSISALLRAEGLIELAVAVAAYRYVGGPWLMFAVLFLLPDASMVGYIANPRIGARIYNLGHTYVAPALMALAGIAMAAPVLQMMALIWAAHIGFDRLLGYGLKYPSAFRATHLGSVRDA
jgi:hypothetical protein